MGRKFGVIGGDRRQAELAALLAADGQAVLTYGLGRWDTAWEEPVQKAAAAEIVILPLPLCRQQRLNCGGGPEMEQVWRWFRPGQVLLAGKIPPEELQAARDIGLDLTDYFLREELTVANAAITAEGAVQTAMTELPVTLWGTECLVLGCGRIGKLLAQRLTGLGARVTVTARKPKDLAWIRAWGWRGLRTDRLDGELASVQVVFNTVPALILEEALLRQLPPSALCVDLASAPGVDFAAAEYIGLHTVQAGALPGKTAPRTAALALRNTVYQILEERGDPV